MWTRLQNRAALARITSLTLFILGWIIIAGWQFNVPLLKGAMFSTYVAPNTALLFVLASSSILLQLQSNRRVCLLGRVLAIPVVLLALCVSCEYLFSTDLHVDSLFMRHVLKDWYVGIPVGRFSPTTAINFLLAGIALLAMRTKHRFALTDLCAGLIMMLCYFGGIGYLYNTRFLYGGVTSPLTLLLFPVLATALWCGSLNGHFADLVTNPFAGGMLVRRVTLFILILLPFFGWLEIIGRRNVFFTRETGIALFVVVAATVITLVVFSTAGRLNELDRRRKQAEGALIQTEKLAATGRMAATIAHEINNPLASVTNLLYLSRYADLDAESRDRFLHSAEQELARVALITRRTLGFYRESTSPIVFYPSKIVVEILDLYRKRIASRGISSKLDLKRDVPIFGMEGEIRQVVSNLLANALDACPDQGGLIVTTVDEQAGQVIIEIADNGSGISKENREQIFEAFFTTKEDVGTGLGLWVSRDLVQKNGGKITLVNEPRPNVSTIFRVTFPANRAGAESAAKA